MATFARKELSTAEFESALHDFEVELFADPDRRKDAVDLQRSAFRVCCKNGNIERAQWMCSFGNIDVHEDNDRAFVEACYFGQPKFARWLLNTFPGVDICRNYQVLMKDAHEHAYDELARWLRMLKSQCEAAGRCLCHCYYKS